MAFEKMTFRPASRQSWPSMVQTYGEDLREMFQLQHVATRGQNAPDSLFLQYFYGVFRALGYRFCSVGVESVVEVEEDGLYVRSHG